MVDFDGLISSDDGKLVTGITSVSRASRMWALIQRNSTSITIKRGTTTLSAQVVKVVIENSGNDERVGESRSVSGLQDAIVYGVRDHASVADTDIEIGDMFVVNGDVHRVIGTTLIPGGIEARTEVIE